MDKSLHKKLSFSLRIFSVNLYFLDTFTEEILNGKLHFCAVNQAILIILNMAIWVQLSIYGVVGDPLLLQDIWYFSQKRFSLSQKVPIRCLGH